MVYEILVGVNVVDEAGYQAYREGMTPILETYGGGFSNDFRVSEVLKAESGNPINRIFTIYFESQSASQAFFANEDYARVKQAHFENSVTVTTIIAGYERE